MARKFVISVLHLLFGLECSRHESQRVDTEMMAGKCPPVHGRDVCSLNEVRRGTLPDIA
jgi:hypothetical protein